MLPNSVFCSKNDKKPFYPTIIEANFKHIQKFQKENRNFGES